MIGRTGAIDDPLRPARHAASEGRFRDALAALEATPAPVKRSAEGALLLAMATWRLGDYRRSRAAALEARDGYRVVGDSDGEMRAENVAAAGAFALGDLNEAERGFSRALALAHSRQDDLTAARCANNLGNVAYYLEHHDAALGYYRLANAGFEKLGFWTGLAEAWLNSAVVWLDAGDAKGSREAAERGVDAAERAAEGRILGQALAAQGETDLALGEIALGRAEAERALALALRHEHVAGEADALRILAVSARLRGQMDDAERLGQRALAIVDQIGDPWRQAEILLELGAVLDREGHEEAAARAFAGAAHAFTTLGAHGRAARAAEGGRGVRTSEAGPAGRSSSGGGGSAPTPPVR
jgi:tetratricopeptide (TPR) repeat protein